MRILRILPALTALVWMACGATAAAQDKKPIAEKHDHQALAEALRDVINTGADLFNKNGDYAGCYRIYQGGLLSIKPFLAPGLQKQIDATIEKAERMPRFSDRVFALRELLGEIRSKSMSKDAGTASTGKDAGGTTKQEVKKTDSKAGGKMTAGLPDPNAGQVTGKVTFDGRPAPPGFVTLVGASQKFSASIAADGAYAFKTPIPPGMYRLTIERVPGAKIPAKLDIPERFRSEETSGLSFQVQKGKQVFDINLSR